MKLQKLYNEYKELKAKADEAEKAYTAYPENTEFEDAFDKAYENEYAAHHNLVAEIIKLTNVDEKTARKMIATERFENLMNMEIA